MLLLLCLADQLFQSIMFFGVSVLNQEHIAISSLSYLMDLFETFAVDVEVASAAEQSFDELEATSH